MALRTKRSRARQRQLIDAKRARRRARHRRREAAADSKPLGDKFAKGESEKSRNSRLGAQQLRHDRRRRRGQANRDPAARPSIAFFGFHPAGGDGRRYHQGAKPSGRRK